MAGRPRPSGCCPPARSRSSSASAAHGQGHETAFSQIVADQLGVGFDDVEILHGDTQSSYRGLDTYGSRSLAVGGVAVVKAAEKVIEKAKPIAAHMLEASECDLEFTAGKFSVKGTDKGVGIQDVALAVFAAHDMPEGVEPDIDAHATFDPENFSFPHGTHLCAVEVDTETGFVSMYKYVCVDDVGNGDQPADRRGPGPRRPGPGHRPGPLRGGRVRRRRAPCSRARWSTTRCPAPRT